MEVFQSQKSRHILFLISSAPLGRYINVIWPIYYGKRLDDMDMLFFSIVFILLSLISALFHVNMISGI